MEEQQWQEYTATMLWSIGAVLAREYWKYPSYIDMKYPDAKDDRTAEQIKKDIVARLLE